MSIKSLRSSYRFSYLFDEFSQRLTKPYFFCFQFNKHTNSQLQHAHEYCEKHGFILNRSTIHTIRKYFTNMVTSAFNHGIEQIDSNEKITDIKLQLTHVNALPSRTEQGVFLIIELGNLVEDVRYSLVSLLGKQIPSYDILHSKSYNLSEKIRQSRGTVLIDHLAMELKHFFEQVSCK